MRAGRIDYPASVNQRETEAGRLGETIPTISETASVSVYVWGTLMDAIGSNVFMSCSHVKGGNL